MSKTIVLEHPYSCYYHNCIFLSANSYILHICKVGKFFWQTLTSYIYVKLRDTVTKDFFKGSYISLYQGAQGTLAINMWKFLENAKACLNYWEGL